MCAAAQLHPDALDSLSPGLVVGGAYQLTRPLGETRRVWEAEQLRLGGRVAIKFLDPSLLQDETARARFEREARAVCEVRSPYIVQIQDHGIDGDVPFLVMELLEGEDLARLLAREHALSLDETTEIIEQLCRALDKAHRAGFVHRDVKPENIFVIQESDGSRFIKLLDFGFVKQLGSQSLTVSHEGLIGTPHYLSPEQITRPGQVDARSDTWAVGVTTYRMLVGRLPFQAQESDEATGLYEAILAGRYQPATALRPELPQALDDWFTQMLAVAPEGRFASLRAASTALATLGRSTVRSKPLSQTRPHVQAATLRGVSTRDAGGSRSRAALSVMGLLLLAAVAVWWVWRAEAPRAKPAQIPQVARPVQPKAAEPLVLPTEPAVAHVATAGAGAAGASAQPAPAQEVVPVPRRKQPPVSKPHAPARVEAKAPAEAPATPLPKDRGF